MFIFLCTFSVLCVMKLCNNDVKKMGENGKKISPKTPEKPEEIHQIWKSSVFPRLASDFIAFLSLPSLLLICAFWALSELHFHQSQCCKKTNKTNGWRIMHPTGRWIQRLCVRNYHDIWSELLSVKIHNNIFRLTKITHSAAKEEKINAPQWKIKQKPY